MLRIFKSKKPSAVELADQAQRIMSGQCLKWGVDAYESAHPKDPRLQDLHARTLGFGLPEEWVKLDGRKKTELNGFIEEREI